MEEEEVEEDSEGMIEIEEMDLEEMETGDDLIN